MPPSDHFEKIFIDNIASEFIRAE